MGIGLALTSFFSVGIPHYESRDSYLWDSAGVVLEYPLPLSFPFYASLHFERMTTAHNMRHIGFDKETYHLHFLTLILHDSVVYKIVWGGPIPAVPFMSITWGHYILYYSFFLLVNIVGAIIGYWISKTTFINKLLKKRTSQ